MGKPQRAQFTVFFPPELVRDLDSLAGIDECSRAALMRRVLSEYVTRRRRAIAAYRRKLAQNEAA